MKNKLNIKKFTLIELIIVIVVIGALAGMALPKFIGIEKDAKVSAMDQDLDVLEKAVQLYESKNDGGYPFVKDGSGNYVKVSITRQTLKDVLDSIGDDESSVYTLDMDNLKPYLERLKYTDSTTDTYLYSTKTNVAINEQGKIDSSGITHHILNGLSNTSSGSTITTKPKITIMDNSFSSYNTFVLVNNNLYGTGFNPYGELGDNTTIDAQTFVNISSISGIKFKKVVTGDSHTLAIGIDGELYTWGNNWAGQLGNGTTNHKLTPTKITLASGIKPTQIACGAKHSMAIGDDGELYTWGANSFGEIGDGTYTNKLTPTKITLTNGVKPTQIACGDSYSMAIDSDGELYTWGANGFGQLGNGTTFNELTPTKITLTNGVKPTQIAFGDSHSMAIGSDGELYTWGANGVGQLGDNTTTDRVYPIKITLPDGIKPKQIACGSQHSMAIGSDGELYTWGYNNIGQLGDGSTTKKLTPTKIELANGIKTKQIACGEYHSMAIGSDGELYTWGQNDCGQLGDGTTDDKNIPTKIDFNFE